MLGLTSTSRPGSCAFTSLRTTEKGETRGVWNAEKGGSARRSGEGEIPMGYVPYHNLNLIGEMVPNRTLAFAAGISNWKRKVEYSHQVAKLALCSSAVRVDGHPKTVCWLAVLIASSHTWRTIGWGALSISRTGFLTVGSARCRVHWWWSLEVKLPWGLLECELGLSMDEPCFGLLRPKRWKFQRDSTYGNLLKRIWHGQKNDFWYHVGVTKSWDCRSVFTRSVVYLDRKETPVGFTTWSAWPWFKKDATDTRMVVGNQMQWHDQ